MSASTPLRLKLLAVLLLFGCLQSLSGLSQGGAPIDVSHLDVVRPLVLAVFAAGAAWGLWHGRRWGAVCLLFVGIVGFTRYVVPAAPLAPIDAMFLLLPASLYALTIAYAWRSTSQGDCR
jgi:hypothetical protein